MADDYEHGRWDNPLTAVQETKDADRVYAAYADEYKKRYGVEPIVIDGADLAVIKDITRKLGVQRAALLLRAYVRMNDNQFVEKGHSLYTLKYNIARVNSYLGTKLTQKQTNAGVRIGVSLSCDVCHQYFDWVGAATELEAFRCCPNCTTNPQIPEPTNEPKPTGPLAETIQSLLDQRGS